MFYHLWFGVTVVASFGVSQLFRIWFANQVVYNPHLAFGLDLYPGSATVISVVFLGVVLAWYFTWRTLDLPTAIASGLVVGGGASNLAERFLFNGAVADYWNWFDLTTGNLADVMIFVGILIWLWRFLTNE